MLPYFSHKEAMKHRYGEALYRIPVNVEFGCPNRRNDGSGGCSFCPEHGARAAQIADAKNVQEQIEQAMAFAKRRYRAKRFALYLQAYTGTFASLAQQKKVYDTLLKAYAFDAIYIGTRPDCLSEATLDYLQELNETIDVVIELGIQSMHDQTLRRIHRGHDGACSLDAIRRLRQRGLCVYGHLIIGLPGEDALMWRQSVQSIIEAGIEGIKFHHLHVIEKTDLADEYAQTPFPLFSEYEYAEALITLLRHVPSHLPILRLATDTPEHELIAPVWHMSKGQFGEYVAQTMRYRGIVQGDLVVSSNLLQSSLPHHSEVLSDGSVTFWNETYRDYYHPKAGAYVQAEKLFIKASNLEERLEKRDVSVLEIGLGMGYNALKAVELAEKLHTHTLRYTAIDQDRMVLNRAASIVPKTLHVMFLKSLFNDGFFETTHAHAQFINAEARYAMTRLDEEFDVIFLDPFSESNNATLVTLELFQKLKKLLKPEGVLVASTTLLASQIGLNLAGFDVALIQDPLSDIRGIVAKVSSSSFSHTKKPYHDPFGVWSDKYIETLHQKSSL